MVQFKNHFLKISIVTMTFILSARTKPPVPRGNYYRIIKYLIHHNSNLAFRKC